MFKILRKSKQQTNDSSLCSLRCLMSFRTPLNAFINSTQIIEYSFDNIKQKLRFYPEIENQIEQWYFKIDKMIKIAKISSKQLMNLVEDILDLARFDAGKFELNISSFKLNDVLKEIEYIFLFQCQEKHISFNIIWSRWMRDRVYRSDEKRIKQILINLISNSLKFTQEGGITLRVDRRTKHGKDFLKFEVEDTGIGIKREDLPKLFKMFGMIERHRLQYNKSGTGIGLSISKMLSESLGGKIEVDSVEGRWTKFTFYVEDIWWEENIEQIDETSEVIDDEDDTDQNSSIQNIYSSEYKTWICFND